MSDSLSQPPSYEYVAFIDEAGDPGLSTVYPTDPHGSSEWMALGAVVMFKACEPKIVSWTARMRQNLNVTQRRDIHYRDLSPKKRLAVCLMTSKLPIRSFAVLSNKTNMRKYRNESAEKFPSKNWFYNFCIRILLERLSDFVARDSLERFGEKRRVKIIFSERGGHSYRHTETYQELLSIQGKAQTLYLNKRSVDWDVIHWKLMEPLSHKNSAGCQLADVVTSAFFQAADARKSSWSPESAETLRPIMANEVQNNVEYCAEYGVTLMPWRRRDRDKLSDEQKHIFRFYGYVL